MIDAFKNIALPDGTSDHVVVEAPLILEIDGGPIVNMRTPGDDESWATGYLFSEGIVRERGEIESLQFERGDRGHEETHNLKAPCADTVRVRLAKGARERYAIGGVRRSNEIRASCGVCGINSTANMLIGMKKLPAGAPKVDRERLTRMADEMRKRQAVFEKSGGCHAAAIFSGAGEMWAIGEDVGRHNALDKAIGRCIIDGRDFANGIAILSGRGGYELVIKSLRVGIPVIASISAVSDMSVELCGVSGATLIGFLRNGGCRVYCDSNRFDG